jgi:hypothetical protein
MNSLPLLMDCVELLLALPLLLFDFEPDLVVVHSHVDEYYKLHVFLVDREDTCRRNCV